MEKSYATIINLLRLRNKVHPIERKLKYEVFQKKIITDNLRHFC